MSVWCSKLPQMDELKVVSVLPWFAPCCIVLLLLNYHFYHSDGCIFGGFIYVISLTGHRDVAASSSLTLAGCLWSVVYVQLYRSSCETAVDIWRIGTYIIYCQQVYIVMYILLVRKVLTSPLCSQPGVVASYTSVPWYYYRPIYDLHLVELVSVSGPCQIRFQKAFICHIIELQPALYAVD